MAYNVITDIDSSSAKHRAEGKEVAAALGAMNGCGPAAEQAILPDRYPSDELMAKLTCDDEVVAIEAEESELRSAVAEMKSAFGK